MKSLLKIFIAFTLVVALTNVVFAATSSNSINISASLAPTCGNGTIDTGEACDNGSSNGACPATCSASCAVNSCGGPITVTETLTIAGISASTQCTSADISWQTLMSPSNDPSLTTGYLQYWLDATPANKTTINITTSSASHIVSLTGLIVSENYSYSIHADNGTSTVDSAINGFSVTCAVPAPVLSVLAQNKGTNLSLTYPNYNDIAGVVVYPGAVSCPATATPVYQSSTSKTASSQETVPGDNPTNLDQIYGYSACIYNSYGVYSAAAYATAQRTASEISSPAAVPGDKQITLSWTNPTDNTSQDFSFAAARLIHVSGNCTATTGINDGTLLQEGPQNSFTHANLANGQIYHYKIFAKNSYDEYSPGLCLSETPIAQPQARCISGISSYATSGQAFISWINPADEAGVFTLNNVRWQRDNACANLPSEGQNVYSGQGQSFANSISENINYYYTAFVNYNNNQTVSCGCFGVILLPVQQITLPEQPIEPAAICENCQVISQSPAFNFSVNNGALPITADPAGKLSILSGYVLTISTPAANVPKPVSVITVNLAGKQYFLALDANQQNYRLDITVPANYGDHVLQVFTVYEDQTISQSQWQLQVLPWGTVLNAKENNPIAGAEITLYGAAGIFAGFGVANPALSNNNGAYGFMVPNGTYRLIAKLAGYLDYTQDSIVVANNIINLNLNLTPEKEIIPITEIAEEINEAVKQIQKVLDQPEVQIANTAIVAPAIAAVNIIAVATAIPWWNFWTFMQFLFTEPWIFLFRRKRQGYGIVYNSITKMPVGLAIVRLIDAKTKRLVQTRVTDKDGRYIFLVDQGEYILEASKPGFEFPSHLLKNANEDNKYTDLYYGQNINVVEGKKGIIMANIPLDQKGLTITDSQALKKHFWLGVKKNIVIIGPLLALISLLVTPNWITGAILGVHILLFMLFKYLADIKKPKSWGIIFDEKHRKPLGRAVTRIFSPEYDRMLDVYVTDNYGRYGFLAGHNVYYLTADKDGYHQSRTDNLDLRQKTSAEVINKDITLKPKSGDSDINAPEQINPPTEVQPGNSGQPENLPEQIESPETQPAETVEQAKDESVTVERQSVGESVAQQSAENVAPEPKEKDENLFG